MSDATPVVDDQEMLRAYAETIRLKDVEIERLKALVKDRMYELQELNELKALLTRAADALEDAPIDHAKGCPISGICVCAVGKERVLICAELRKAAQ